LNFGASLGGARFAIFAAIKEVGGGSVLDHAVSGCQRCREKMKGMGLILTVGGGSPAQVVEELHFSYLDA